jgi:hypothetical protein
MSKEIILAELNKENIDWIKISNLSREIYINSQEKNPIGLKKGVINIIKCAKWSCETVSDELVKNFDVEDYSWMIVGSYGMTVTKFNKLIPGLKNNNTKFITIFTDRNEVYANLSKQGIETNLISCSLSWKNDSMKLKGADVNFTWIKGNFKQCLRDESLKSLGV